MKKELNIYEGLVTFCYNKPISGSVRMASDSLTTSLLQVATSVILTGLFSLQLDEIDKLVATC